MRGKLFHGRGGAMALAALCGFWAQSACAAHWMMTGRMGQGDQARVAGIDRDSVIAAQGGILHATMLSIEVMPPGSRKVLAELELDCPRLRLRAASMTIWRESGARARILSGRGDDWQAPKTSDDRALMVAACTRDFSGLTDAGDQSPDAYAAALLGTPPDFGS